MSDNKFTYPFRYTPSASVRAAASELISRLENHRAPEIWGEDFIAELRRGKMLGVMLCRDRNTGEVQVLNAFSGLVAGKAAAHGFVPPILDTTDPAGHFKTEERRISAMPDGPAKSRASECLQDWLFDNYIVSNAAGESLSIKEVFALRGLVPPGGTGECAAPKLLQYAYAHGLHPLEMGEFWYGESSVREVRQQGHFYPSCAGKCGPLLSWMMRGLDVEPNPLDEGYTLNEDPKILFQDESIIIVDKPAGMLSVPGRTKSESLLDWLREHISPDIQSCHRLDMDTSGVMVYAMSVPVKVEMERQFAQHEVVKTYRARLSNGDKPFSHRKQGTIALPLSLDYYDRPRQIVDFEHGKKAITKYQVIEELPNGELEVRFIPLTGRSHQIRVHAAHVKGLGRPIKGDCLYGAADGGRLHLKAESLEFTHPVTKQRLKFQ